MLHWVKEFPNDSGSRQQTKWLLLRCSAFCVFCIELSLYPQSFKVHGLQMTIKFALGTVHYFYRKGGGRIWGWVMTFLMSWKGGHNFLMSWKGGHQVFFFFFFFFFLFFHFQKRFSVPNHVFFLIIRCGLDKNGQWNCVSYAHQIQHFPGPLWTPQPQAVLPTIRNRMTPMHKRAQRGGAWGWCHDGISD